MYLPLANDAKCKTIFFFAQTASKKFFKNGFEAIRQLVFNKMNRMLDALFVFMKDVYCLQ